MLMKVYSNILEMVGSTPMLEVTQDRREGFSCVLAIESGDGHQFDGLVDDGDDIVCAEDGGGVVDRAILGASTWF